MHIDFEQDETQSKIIITNNVQPKGSFKLTSTKSLKPNVFKQQKHKKEYEHQNQSIVSKFVDIELDGQLCIPSENSQMPRTNRSKQTNKPQPQSIKENKKIYRIDFQEDDDDTSNQNYEDESQDKQSSQPGNNQQQHSQSTQQHDDQQVHSKLNQNIFQIDVQSQQQNVQQSASQYEQNDCAKSNGNDSDKLKQSHFPINHSNHTVVTAAATAKFMIGKEIIPMDILTFQARKQMLYSQIAQNKMLKCVVSRRKNIKNVMKSQYDMKFQIDKGGFLATCRKDIGISGIKYTLSLQSDNFKQKYSVIGKIKQQGNTFLFNVYDQKSSNPADKKSKKAQVILATIRIICRKDSPRETTVYILNHNADYNSLIKPNQNSQDLQSLYGVEQNKTLITQLKSKSPIWIDKHKQYFLSFRGQAKQASYRNFVLENPITGEEALLFGKQQDNTYNINVCYPLAPRIGFAIVIPHLQINS